MSERPTDRRRAAVRIALFAALAAIAGPPPVLAGDGSGDRPVFFRQPDAETARDIRKSIERFDLPSARDREQARDRLFDIGYWTVEPLVDTVVHKQASFRSNALLVLGRLDDPRALPVARATLRDNVAEWPPAIAALVLGTMRDGDSEALDAFKQALASRENEKRKIAVVLALGKLHRVHPGRGAVLIEEVLAAPTATPFVHYAAVLALGFHRNRVSEPAPDGNGFVPSARLRAALADPREGMRLSAVLALALSPQDSFRPVFLERFREDGDKDVRLVSLLALGRPGNPDPEITALIAAVLESTKPSDAERRLAAYLLQVRADPAARDALIRTANAPRSTEVAASAVLALAGLDDPRARDLIFSKLSASSATVRAAAAIALTRLKTMEDLSRARVAIAKRLEIGEPDGKCKFDMQLAADEIVKCMRDIQDRAQGIEPKPRPSPPWEEADAKDLFDTLGRTHRERVFDFVNARARQVLGVASLLDYRPRSEPDFSTPTLDGQGGGGGGRRAMRENGAIGEPRDLEVELLRRPYFAPEDDPEGAPAAVPKGPR